MGVDLHEKFPRWVTKNFCWGTTPSPRIQVPPLGTDITGKISRKSNAATVAFDEGSVLIGEERYTDWKVGWKKLKKILSKVQKEINNKVLQSRRSKAKYQNNMAKTTLGG